VRYERMASMIRAPRSSSALSLYQYDGGDGVSFVIISPNISLAYSLV